MAPKTDVIEQLRERVRELEEENARLRDAVRQQESQVLREQTTSLDIYQQLAASQLRETQLRDLLANAIQFQDSYYRYADAIAEALSKPTSTEALDAYVAEKVKEADEDCLRLIETVKYLRGIAERGTGEQCPDNVTVEAFILSYVQTLELEQTAHQQIERLLHKQAEQIATLTRQRDLAVEALEGIASSLPQIGVERVWMLDHANKTLAAIKESEK